MRAKGEVLITAREGKQMALGDGVGPNGSPAINPNEVLMGALVIFGGYKGVTIGLMIKFLSSSLIGEWVVYEQKERDNEDGSPTRGGELLIAIDPARELAVSPLNAIRAATQPGWYTPSLRSASRQPKGKADREDFHTAVTLRQNYRIDLRRMNVFLPIRAVRFCC